MIECPNCNFKYCCDRYANAIIHGLTKKGNALETRKGSESSDYAWMRLEYCPFCGVKLEK